MLFFWTNASSPCLNPPPPKKKLYTIKKRFINNHIHQRGFRGEAPKKMLRRKRKIDEVEKDAFLPPVSALAAMSFLSENSNKPRERVFRAQLMLLLHRDTATIVLGYAQEIEFVEAKETRRVTHEPRKVGIFHILEQKETIHHLRIGGSGYRDGEFFSEPSNVCYHESAKEVLVCCDGKMQRFSIHDGRFLGVKKVFENGSLPRMACIFGEEIFLVFASNLNAVEVLSADTGEHLRFIKYDQPREEIIDMAVGPSGVYLLICVGTRYDRVSRLLFYPHGGGARAVAPRVLQLDRATLGDDFFTRSLHIESSASVPDLLWICLATFEVCVMAVLDTKTWRFQPRVHIHPFRLFSESPVVFGSQLIFRDSSSMDHQSRRGIVVVDRDTGVQSEIPQIKANDMTLTSKGQLLTCEADLVCFYH
jgi:hypothetical protein